ncbi:type II secretion system F family protein [Vagococcus coleopterorum]|uniref:Type II secretion system F family protein n=1 Tax=Vagococcus coleopterorum TaxID=2714946 RepID=A0A6G8ALJ4_9ENTE|nr:competence type IV pilus assembly protein ComGB [Vagococcus coleopterorum]QIL45829.1 type II secretion system F family protein [Vagococcus coleopterorum]
MALSQQPFIKNKWRWRGRRKREFVEVLSALMINGFTLNEAIPFMEVIMPQLKVELFELNRTFLEGKTLSEGLGLLGFTDYEKMILYLGEMDGNLSESLVLIAERLQKQKARQGELKKVLTYPIILVGFLMGILFAMRWVVLPEVKQTVAGRNQFSFANFIINWGPESVLIIGVIFCLSGVIFLIVTRDKSGLERLSLLSRMPVFHLYISYVMTAFFANEIGKLLLSGLEMQDILKVMGQSGAGRVSKDFSEQVITCYQKGLGWGQSLKGIPFLKKELGHIVQRGEAKGKLGKELMLYSERLWQDLNTKVETALVWIQPLIFVGIAIVILLVYGALLLPIYQEMEGVI